MDSLWKPAISGRARVCLFGRSRISFFLSSKDQRSGTTRTAGSTRNRERAVQFIGKTRCCIVLVKWTSVCKVQGKPPGKRRTEMVCLVAGLLAFLNLLSSALNAQVSGGVLSGTVTDASQAAIPNVRVTLTNLATRVVRAVATDASGFYTAPDLLPGSYEMTAAALGFTTQVRTDITVNVGASLVLNVVMQAGDPGQVVRVAVAGTPADQASSAVGGNVSASTVRDTPLNGRDWTQLAALQAGVTGVQTGSAQGGGNSQRGFGAALSISGARPDQNNYRLDGVSINDYSNGAPGSVLGDNLGVDAVEQFSVLGSNYPAEYGRTTGGGINAVTRSGTNAFHGSVYEFLRNRALDARNFFYAGIPPFKRNQFGGSLGGALRKERTFVFGD